MTVKTYWPQGIGVEIDSPGSATEMYWTHTDRLGSVIAMSDSAGVIKEPLSYDAWGKRRTIDWTATPDTLDGKLDNKGYTGHEMLDQWDLVHMNGRVFDPLTARFISPDPHVTNPFDGQSYNRYSYVLNNPLSYTDPTGFDQDPVVISRSAEILAEVKEAQANFTFVANYTARNELNLSIRDGGWRADQRAVGRGSPDSGSGVVSWLKKAYLPGTSAPDAAEEYQTGGQFEENPMGDPVNPNHPGVGAGQIAAGTLLVGGLGVAGAEAGGLALHQFEGWYLQRVTNSVVANIEADSAFARSFLSPKELANGPLAATFGKVVERAVAERVAANPLMKNLLEYTSKPFIKTPDFVSKFGRGVYDVTTKGTKWGADHLQRGYEGTLRLIEYVRPSWFKF